MKKLFLTLAFLAGSAQAQFWSGNDLHDRMNGTDVEKVAALGFIIGVHDSNKGTVCVPAQATTGQIRDSFAQWMNANPEVRHFSAGSLVLYMLRERWPCRNKETPKEQRL